jgi:hypothetical protein
MQMTISSSNSLSAKATVAVRSLVQIQSNLPPSKVPQAQGSRAMVSRIRTNHPCPRSTMAINRAIPTLLQGPRQRTVLAILSPESSKAVHARGARKAVEHRMSERVQPQIAVAIPSQVPDQTTLAIVADRVNPSLRRSRTKCHNPSRGQKLTKAEAGARLGQRAEEAVSKRMGVPVIRGEATGCKNSREIRLQRWRTQLMTSKSRATMNLILRSATLSSRLSCRNSHAYSSAVVLRNWPITLANCDLIMKSNGSSSSSCACKP